MDEYKEFDDETMKIVKKEIDNVLSSYNGNSEETVAADIEAKESLKDLILDIYNLLFEVCSNCECTEEYGALTEKLICLRQAIKNNLVSAADIRGVPEMVQALIDVAGSSESEGNVCQSLNTIWCIVSRISDLIDDFVDCDCVSACLSKISLNYDKSIVPSLAILFYITDYSEESIDFVFETVSPKVLDEIIDKMAEEYSLNPDMEDLHRRVLNFAPLLLIPYARVIEKPFDEESEEKVNALINLLSHVINLTADIGLGYSLQCFQSLIARNVISVQDFLEPEFDIYFVTVMKSKFEENCRLACFLMDLLFERGWKGTRFPAIETMNFIKTCSNASIEFLARVTLQKACTFAAPDTKWEILKNPDFPDLVLYAIAKPDEDDYSAVAYGNFRFMETAGRSLLGIFHKPELSDFYDFYCKDVMLALVSLLRLGNDEITLESLQTIMNLISHLNLCGKIEVIRNDFIEVNGKDILDEFVEDDNEEICHCVMSILEELELLD